MHRGPFSLYFQKKYEKPIFKYVCDFLCFLLDFYKLFVKNENIRLDSIGICGLYVKISTEIKQMLIFNHLHTVFIDNV